uniref:Uncharacterized protein n=1 Tax=Anguilla anguilla TaxID=7936 RepID=A0A0E9WDY6_ANGAN
MRSFADNEIFLYACSMQFISTFLFMSYFREN